jgi:mono/diheme cytochrome c family protein
MKVDLPALRFARIALLCLTGLATACNYGIRDIASVPDNPTFNRDIYPLYADHCLVCHSSPPDRGAPSYFRLDTYDDTTAAAGAKSMAAAALGDVQSGRMPPAAREGDGVGPNGLLMLQRWVQHDSPR